ncbi:lipopolysaccharide/colanic/teichoic acid biosynthesis glycosyltransferase [Cerasibacillus quisquiliarum]|uniref:UDP-galactose phosphate transferase n=1 Tax=Cerasibacillus quisquiliarum TaxID=227865 RepID=A0A511UYD8_9BACI|nr:sugar transferase [Cerasibacillus quisquiliarum]MBB5144962.1 lipopolysaccharide/colanic/teichoic acid biosynthesis glycosyltransferase [Cerasibacillus quisquiliarum]GEN30142.1 UDP-galactose phosphate transferase [Cerasibacillus quisquiliarum]
MRKNNFYKKYIKRVFDIVFSLFALILLSPVLLILAVLIKLNLGSPILFKQQRPGLYGKVFTIYKFRTMTDEKDETGELLDDHLRLTKFGRFLRSTSMDELPELLNILKGDMSFIGPRPLLVEYLPLYNNEQMRRHEVRPGLSGLAQVNGRNELSWEEKFYHDIYYVDNVSLYLDLKIFFLTLRKVIMREGISFSNEKKDNKFKGDKEKII